MAMRLKRVLFEEAVESEEELKAEVEELGRDEEEEYDYELPDEDEEE